MDRPVLASSNESFKIPHAQTYYDEMQTAMGTFRVAGGNLLEEEQMRGVGPSAAPASLDDNSTADILSRVSDIQDRFLRDAQGAFNSLTDRLPTVSSRSASASLDDVEETQQMTAVISLLDQIMKFQKLTQSHDPELSRLMGRVKELKIKLFAEEPSIMLTPSDSLRNWGTMTVSATKKSKFPPFVIPLDPQKAIDEIGNHPLSDRCKVQILMSVFQKIEDLMYQLEKFEQNLVPSKRKAKVRAPTVAETVEYFSKVPNLFPPSQQEILRGIGEKDVLGVICERRDSLQNDLATLQLNVEKQFSFRQRKAVFSFLSQILKRENKTDRKTLATLARFLDPRGVLRATMIIEEGQSAVRVGRSLGKLLTSLVRNAPPEVVLQGWHEVLTLERVPVSLNLDLKSLAQAFTQFQGNMRYEAASLCVEFLMHFMDPTGILIASSFLEKKPDLKSYCQAFGLAEMMLFKMHRVLKLSKDKAFDYLQSSLHTAFDVQTKELKRRQATEAKQSRPFDFSKEILPALKRGRLSSPLRQELAQTIFHRSAELFAKLPLQVFYDDAWTTAPQYLALTQEADRLSQFIFMKVLEGSTVKERAHIMGMFYRMASEAIELGEFFLPVYMVCTKMKTWETRFKEEFALLQQGKRYREAEAKVLAVIDPSRNYAATREHESKCESKGLVITPYVPMYTRELRFLFDGKKNVFHILSMGNRFFELLISMRYFHRFQTDEFVTNTTFLREWQSHELVSDDALYAMTTKPKEDSLGEG